ncbi:MAG TPA: MFS transporter [Actinocrinis sp.]
MTSATRLRAQRPFVLLFTGGTISSAGNAIAPIAIAFAVLETTGSTADLGFVVAGRTLALAVCVLFGGAVADRLPRRSVMLAGALAAGASEAATAALLLSHSANIGLIVALQAFNGAVTGFVMPASRSAIPQTVPPELLHQANVVNRMGANATSILGAAVGGILIAAVGPGWGVAVDSGTFFAAAACFLMLRLPSTTPENERDSEGIGRQLAAGWRDFRSRTWLWTIVLQFALVNAGVDGVFDVLGPTTAQRELGGARAWGLIMAFWSIGFVAGGVLATRLKYVRRPLLVGALGVVPTGAFLGLIAVPLAVPALCAVALVTGAGIEVFGVEWDVTMQRHIPADRLSRVYSYDMLGSFVFIPLGQVFAGLIQPALGLTTSVALCALIAFVPSVLVLAVRDVRTLPGEPRPAKIESCV